MGKWRHWSSHTEGAEGWSPERKLRHKEGLIQQTGLRWQLASCASNSFPEILGHLWIGD